MEFVRTLFGKPDPETQRRKCNTLIRTNLRKIEREIQNMRSMETKTKSYILQASRRAKASQRSTTQYNATEMRILARELIRIRKHTTRLHTQRAQLQSIQMRVNEAFAIRRIDGTLRASALVMRDVNSLFSLPEFCGSMRALSQELVKAGIIEEMIEDSMPAGESLEGGIGDEEEMDGEVDEVLSEILDQRVPGANDVALTGKEVNDSQVSSSFNAEEAEIFRELNIPVNGALTKDANGPNKRETDGESHEDILAQMRGRLEALKH